MFLAAMITSVYAFLCLYVLLLSILVGELTIPFRMILDWFWTYSLSCDLHIV